MKKWQMLVLGLLFMAALLCGCGRRDAQEARETFANRQDLRLAVLPEGAREREVTLFEGTPRALGGSLVAPENADADTAYVVLIHGMGPSDRDSTHGASKLFRDLAYGLAAQGVGSLRFDKITYTYPKAQVETVADEYREPVLEALRVLQKETDAARIYAAGHSEGGMLMPWLVSESGADGFAGGIALAGTPRLMWEIAYAQYSRKLEAMVLPESKREAYAEKLENELKRAEALIKMSDDAQRATTLFGVDAYYMIFASELDEIALALSTGKPMLFLWGEADMQIYEEDFEAWRAGLSDSKRFTYVRYPGLNHMFMPAQSGDSILDLSKAYARAAFVAQEVILDIAGWIERNA